MYTNRKILLYGIGGAREAYRVLAYYCIFNDDISITNIWKMAAWLRASNPSIKQVFAMDDRRGLKREYMDSLRLNSIESHMIFKDILEREGREIKE